MATGIYAKINARYHQDLDDVVIWHNAQEQLTAEERRRLRLQRERVKLADAQWEESQLCDGSDSYKHLSTERSKLQKKVQWLVEE